MASVHRNIIVVVNSVDTFNVEPWIDNPGAETVGGLMLLAFLSCISIAPRYPLTRWVLWVGSGGSGARIGIESVLDGDYNPSGRLLYTIVRDSGFPQPSIQRAPHLLTR